MQLNTNLGYDFRLNPEIEMYLRELELTKGIKLKVIVIDYINILANYRNPNTENTYMKIKQIAEDLRAMAVRNDWVVITIKT
jgi:archaellum biogenesis ATPase FlaH